MKAAGALPTEERVQKMSNIQWLWYYKNLIKDEEENESLMKSRIDYLAFFVNPELHKSVMDIANGNIYKDENDEIIQKTPVPKKEGVYVNDSFEEELKAALGDEALTVLPDSSSAGNANMSQDDFLRMAEQMQQFSMEMDNLNQDINGKEIVNKQSVEVPVDNSEVYEKEIDEYDLDYFE